MSLRSGLLCMLWSITGWVLLAVDDIPAWWHAVTFVLALPTAVYVVREFRRTGHWPAPD